MQGNKRIRTALILQEVVAAKGARTHEELAEELTRAQERLYDLDAFRNTVCNVDVGEVNDEVSGVNGMTSRIRDAWKTAEDRRTWESDA